MVLIILAAGFGTRLGTRTATIPKQLLPISGGFVMDLFYQSLENVIDKFDKKTLITNEVYYKDFMRWASGRRAGIEVISNGVANKGDKIGAIGDLLRVVGETGVNDDVFVVAPDYILKNINMNDMFDFIDNKDVSTTLYRIETDKQTIRAGSCMELSDDGKIVKFEEKPPLPFSQNYGVPYYFVKKADIEKLKNIPKELRDNSGQIVAQLVKVSEIYGYKYEGDFIHLTSEDDYQKVFKEERVEKV